MQSESSRAGGGFADERLGARPLVSVVMNCHDGARYLAEAIDSVFAQRYPEWEIVFVDNASRDDSARIAAGYGDRVRCFSTGELIPLGAARNVALRAARGDVIGFLDCDDTWEPDKLEAQIALLADDPDVGIVHCDVRLLSERGSRRLFAGREAPSGYAFPALLVDYSLPMPGVMATRRALESLDFPFDERMVVAEDLDLFLRLALRWKIGYVGEVLATYRIGGQSLTHTRLERFAVEMDWVLERLRALHPDLERDYGDAVDRYRSRRAYLAMMAHARAGDMSAARRAGRPYVLSGPRFFAAYALTFLGARSFERAYTWVRGLG